MQRFEPAIYNTLIKRQVFDDANEIEIRLRCYRIFVTFWIVSGGLYIQTFYLQIRGNLNNFESSVNTPDLEAIC